MDNQDYSKDDIRGTYSITGADTDKPSPSLNQCVGAWIEFDSKKRKSPAVSIFVPDKKARLDEGTGRHSQSLGSWQFPAEIWHHIFILLPPKTLGRLLSVNKCFNYFLNPAPNYSCDAPLPVLTGCLSTLKPEVIWQLSRRRFWPTMPTPLRGHTELQMWQLVCQNGCQFCGRTGQLNALPAHDPPNGKCKQTGPRPIWPFALRSCRPCLVERTTKEVDLLLSSSVPSCLIPALSFIFVSDNMEIIPSAMLQAGQATLGLSITKIFLSSHVANIHDEFISVRAMGEATAEEWLKGLEGRGKEYRADSLRWEKFEMSGGLLQMRHRLSSENTRVNNKYSEAIKGPIPSAASYSIEIRGGPPRLSTNPSTSEIALAIPTPLFPSSQDSSCAKPIQEHQSYTQVNVPRSKTREEAEEMKAARRTEIEKRAAELEPPLPAHVLALIPSFQAAIQITSPLDDTAWNLLKPRLIAQRGDINQKHHQNQEASAHSHAMFKQSEVPQSPQRLAFEAKQKTDKTWDDAQAPLRARISMLADRFIHDCWGNGRKVNKESSSQFAIGILLYVRTRFYAEVEKDEDILNRLDIAARAAGKEPLSETPNGPFTRKLTLENMKWLFDVKVKPLTDPYMKELFYCRGCDANNKLYGFEGVVQHYAAKHTGSLSLGSVVVHWRAEWPEPPPFHPEPHNLKNQWGGFPKHQADEANGSLGDIIPLAAREQPLHQEGLVPYYGQPMPQIRYDGVPIPHLHGQIHPYIPSLSDYAHDFQGQALRDHSNPLSNGTPYEEPPGVFRGGGLYAPVHTTNVNVHQSHRYIPYRNYATPQLQSSCNIQFTSAYYKKLEDVAQNSRALWFSIAHLRGLPGHVKIFVVIHHVCTRFRARFSEEPSLNLFMDGLSNNKDMRPIRNVNGLQCRACFLGLGIISNPNQEYSLPQLVRHFYQQHVEQQHVIGAPVLDWYIDMIHLPDLRILSNLGNLTNIDNRKLALINSALSEATLRDSKLHPGLGPLHLGHKISDSRRHSSTVRPANERVLIQQPHIQHKDLFQGTNNCDLAACSTDEVISESIQPGSYSAGLDGSGVRSRPSILKAGHQSINKASADTTATSSTGSGIQISSVPRPSETTGNDEEDDFDLLAALESQLDQQASSVRPDNPLGQTN